jgi:hypothetical protein
MQWATRAPKAEYYALLKQEEKRGNFQVWMVGLGQGVLQFVFNLSTAKMRVASHLLR